MGRSSIIKKNTTSLNVVVLGAAGVGKTSIISRFLHHKFPKDTDFTVELEEQTGSLGDEKDVILNVVDTPGGYCFKDTRTMAIDSGDAFILVFSLDDESSVITAAMLRDDIMRIKPKNTPLLLVGNKADVEAHTHITDKKDASLFAKKEWKTKYIETSAKEGLNIHEIFNQILKLSKKKQSMCEQCFPKLPVCLRRRKNISNEGFSSSLYQLS